MIRVDELKVHEFRGIRDLTLNLKGANFAICGPNGTGKSGVVDAVEFALTGNISRLTGSGTGGLSVKDHGPHVDSRNKPEQSYVELKVTIPSLAKSATIRRTVKDAKAPVITPSDADIRGVLNEVALHPEFVLSRRELIRYVLSEPGKRSKEVQALLRLDEIEALRSVLQRISNSATKAIDPLHRVRNDAITALTKALQITELTSTAILAGANERRAILSLPLLLTLSATTSLKDGLTTVASTPSTRVSRAQALTDLTSVEEALDAMRAESFANACSEASAACDDLVKDAAILESVSREALLRSALELFDEEHCPVCDTEWVPDEFKDLVAAKLAAFEEVSAKRKSLDAQCNAILPILDSARASLQAIAKYGALLTPTVDTTTLNNYEGVLTAQCGVLENVLPLDKTIAALKAAPVIPEIGKTLAALKTSIEAIPEPTVQDGARDYLIIGQEKLETYRSASLALQAAKERAVKALKVFNLFGKVTTEALDAIYKKVETSFGDLYREINTDDESQFTAQLTPSLGKLGFDVDFYGRGHFPPGAYHSEGHQDGMGLCLYLALMAHLLGDGFTFAVLDDVLMSVDAGHRREVVALLRSKFPNTQFILTTHDEIWLRHMKTAGLIPSNAAAHFRQWTVDAGPTEWDDRNVWDEIAADLKLNNVQRASATLRHYLEYFSREVCHRLRAKVEFRGDAQFMLGDLLPPALGAMADALKKGKASANSWGKQDVVQAISAIETIFVEARRASSVDQWQVNAAVHYNEWTNFQKNDFGPVADAFQKLVEAMRCHDCGEVLYIMPERGDKEALRCSCGTSNINLVSK